MKNARFIYPRHKVIAPALVLLFMLAARVPLAVADAATSFDMKSAWKAIELRAREFENLLRKGDAMALSHMYTEDAEILTGGAPTSSGRAAVAAALQGNVDAGITISQFTTTGLWGNKDLLVEQGTGMFASVDGARKSFGRYLLVWKNVDGQWLIFRDTWFPDPKPKPEKTGD